MVFAPTPGWLVIVVLLCILGYFILKVAFYVIAFIIVFIKIVFIDKHKPDAHEVHLKYHPEDKDK